MGNGEKGRMIKGRNLLNQLFFFIRGIMEHSFGLRGICSQRNQDWDLMNKSADVEQIYMCFSRADLPLCGQ